MKMKALMVGVLILGANAGWADALLMQDSFDCGGVTTNNINTDVAVRQSGYQAPANWRDNTEEGTSGGDGTSWLTKIDSDALRLYKNIKGSTFARLSEEFSAISSDVRIAVDIKNINFGSGFSMVNFGLGWADGFSSAAGYRFQLDQRYAVKRLNFYDNGTLAGTRDVTSIVSSTVAFESLVIDFTGSNTVSATLNGTTVDFGGGVTSYTGTSEANNYVMLGWYNSSGTTSASFDNLAVTSIPEPATLGLIGIVSAGLIGIRRLMI